MKAAVAPQPQNVKAKRAGGRCSYCSSSVCTNSRSSTNSSSDSGSSDPTTPSKLSPCAYMNVHKYAAIQEWASTVSVSVSASASANATANTSSTQPTESTYANPTRAPSLSPSRYFYEPPPSPSVRYSNLNQTQNRNWDRDTSKSPHLSSPNCDFLSDHTPQYPQQDFNLLSPRYRLQPALGYAYEERSWVFSSPPPAPPSDTYYELEYPHTHTHMQTTPTGSRKYYNNYEGMGRRDN